MTLVPDSCQLEGCAGAVYCIGFAPDGKGSGTWLCEAHAVEKLLLGDWTDFPPAAPQAPTGRTLGDTLSTPTPIETRPPGPLRFSGGLPVPIRQHLQRLGYRLERVDASALAV